MRLTIPDNALLRPVDATDFSDLTRADQVGPSAWVEPNTVEIPFDVEPSEAEQAAIRLRLLTRDDAHEAQVVAMRDALAALDDAPTTPAELRAAVKLTLTVLLGDLA